MALMVRGRKVLESEILDLTNQFRREGGLPDLSWHKGLAAVAKIHATQVAEGRRHFSHEGAMERFAACGTKCINVAENLARSEGFGRDDLPEAALAGWRESEGHRRNLLGPFDSCGIGWAASDAGVIYVTQLFALLDERSRQRGELMEKVTDIATSTPAICSVIGLVLGGPTVAVGAGLVGKVLIERKIGLKVASIPRALKDRVSSRIQPTKCEGCGKSVDTGLLVSEAEHKFLCTECHPSPEDSNLWCFID